MEKNITSEYFKFYSKQKSSPVTTASFYKPQNKDPE